MRKRRVGVLRLHPGGTAAWPGSAWRRATTLRNVEYQLPRARPRPRHHDAAGRPRGGRGGGRPGRGARRTSGHSRWVLGAADALLRGLGIAPGDLDGFAVTVGPGSFTGLQVGISSIQGLAIAAGRPCVGLSALDLLALAAATAGGAASRIVSLMDAFRGET
ncbi:MAG: tRNA (adenosine(37)-N6)-threonylcarbamoyltransferase complex dimerization subunit type 1 TsaB [Vicinamibacteria bacterium]